MEKDRWSVYDRDIRKVFNRFAGKAVDPANPNDPVLEAMRTEATMHYSYLRLVAPGTKREDDADDKITRINAELVANKDGTWRIGKRFFRG
jgi:hypothetical protein